MNPTATSVSHRRSLRHQSCTVGRQIIAPSRKSWQLKPDTRHLNGAIMGKNRVYVHIHLPGGSVYGRPGTAPHDQLRHASALI